MVDWNIGPTFTAELRAANVPLDGYSWDWATGDITFAESVSDAVVTQVNAVYAAHDPAAQTVPPAPYPPGSPPDANAWKVPRTMVIDRLVAANKFGKFMDALDDSTQLQREMWHALDAIPNDTAFIITLLNEAGANPTAILARP
jgi:hypothetical protein